MNPASFILARRPPGAIDTLHTAVIAVTTGAFCDIGFDRYDVSRPSFHLRDLDAVGVDPAGRRMHDAPQRILAFDHACVRARAVVHGDGARRESRQAAEPSEEGILHAVSMEHCDAHCWRRSAGSGL